MLLERLKTTAASPAGSFDHPDAWTIAAIENGFQSMESLREPAARLEKLATKWVDRVLPKRSFASRFLTAARSGKLSWSKLSPLHKKSPFLALSRTTDPRAPVFGVAERSGRGSCRAMAAALGEVEQSLSRAMESVSDGTRPLLRPQSTPQSWSSIRWPAQTVREPAATTRAAQREVIRFWDTPGNMTILGKPQRIPPVELEAMQDRVLAWLTPESSTGGHLPPDRQASLKKEVREALARENRQMDPKRLMDMAHAIPGCDVTRVQRLLAQTGIPPAPGATIGRISRESLSASLCNALEGMDEGSRISLSGGGVIGAGLKGTSSTLSGLFSGGVLGLRLDARAERCRQALCEIGAPEYGVELLAGAQTLRKKQLGLGVFVGANMGPMVMGGGIDVAAMRESTSTDSVLLRLARTEDGLHGTKRTLLLFQDVVRCLFEDNPGWRGKESGQNSNLLVRLFKRFPDLSIGEKASSAVPNRLTALKTSIIAGAIFRGGPLRFGLGGACRAEQRHYHPYHYTEKTGRLRVERLTFGHLRRLNLSIGLHTAGLPISLPGFDGHPDGSTLSDGGGAGAIRWTQHTPGTELAQWNADIYKHGQICRVTLVSDAGSVQPHSSCVRIHDNAHQFVRTVRADIDRWAQALAQRTDAARLAKTGLPRETSISAARDQVLHFLDQTLREAEPAQRFHEHHTLRADVARELSWLQEVVRQAADERSAEPYRRIIQERLESETSWEPAFLIIHDATQDQRSRRLDVLAKIGSVQSKGTTRILRML